MGYDRASGNAGDLQEDGAMTTWSEVYKGFYLTAVEQPNGGWMVEVVKAGGGGKPHLTQPYREQSDAIASAHRMVDNACG